MRSPLLVALLLAVTPLAGLAALAPAASARPCMEDAPCCYGLVLPDGTCVETPCGDHLWPPCPSSPSAASASARTCVPVYRVGAESLTVCVDPASDVCPVFVYRTTQWLSYGTCFPPQADATASADAAAAECLALVDADDFAARLCADPAGPCGVYAETTDKQGTTRACLLASA